MPAPHPSSPTCPTTTEGQGLGSALARGVLDAERSLGEPVVPLCPFMRSYIDRHPGDADLVDREMLARIDGA
jgi:predicted GNAT family acetyltransferase